jgi:hypothetical protein
LPESYGDDRPKQIPLSADDLALWRGHIAKAREVRTIVMRWGEANLIKYAPKLDSDPDAYGEKINTGRDFTLVERKKADLFFQRPDVSVTPSPLMVGQELLLETHGEILNEKLGLDGVDALALAHQCIFDVLCPTGTGWTEMGYESATVPTPMEVPDGEQTMPGAILGLQGVPKTKIVMAPVPIYENCFWSWFSPKQALVPHEARSTKADDWPWIGREFDVPLKTAIAKGWVPKDFEGSPVDPESRFDHGLTASAAGDAVVHGELLYYKSALYRDDRPHPLHQTRLILIDGVDEPAEHQDSPFQTIDPKGRLTPDSLIGYPLHPLTTRTLTDSAFVPSDCTISRATVNELNTFREQMLDQREANVLRWMYNVDTLPPEALAKIVRSPLGGFIGVPGEAFVGEGAIKELPHGTYPRENFAFNDYLDNDLARMHAIDAEQSGAGQKGDQSATESQIKQNNVNARLGIERGQVLNWYLRGVTKFSTLIQRYLTIEDAARIVGFEKAQQWDQWRKVVPASLAFTVLPDSALRTDIASERKRVRDDYTFLVNDPLINRAELLKQSLPKMGYSIKVLNTQPPQKGPEPTKPTFSFKGDDLNPLAPQFPIVIETLRQCGVNISPEAIAAAQTAAAQQVLMGPEPGADTGQGQGAPDTKHGGKAPQMESLSKHENALTGHLQGTGGEAPLGPGGTIQ